MGAVFVNRSELFPSWLLGCRSRASSKRHEAILCFLGSQRGNPWTQCCVIDFAAGFRRRFFFADMSSVEKLWTTARRSVADLDGRAEDLWNNPPYSVSLWS